MNKPLGRKPYNSIGHISQSKLGTKDYCIHEGQERQTLLDFGYKSQHLKLKVACTIKKDGTNVAIARLHGQLFPLVRSGYRAESSPYIQHHLFAKWLYQPDVYLWFFNFLNDGEWLSGEWLAQACGILYDLYAQPFYIFDLYQNGKKVLYDYLLNRLDQELPYCSSPIILHYDFKPYPLELALNKTYSDNFPVSFKSKISFPSFSREEGFIWRVESHSRNKTLWLCKYVNPNHITGRYLVHDGKDLTPTWNIDIDFMMAKVGINFTEFLLQEHKSGYLV